MHGHKLKMVFPMKDLMKEEVSGLGKKTQSRNLIFLYSEVRLLDKEVIKKYKILIQDVENYVLKKNGRRKMKGSAMPKSIALDSFSVSERYGRFVVQK